MSAAYANAIASTENKPALFFEVHFVSGPVYVWSGLGSIDWNGQTWLGAGGLIEVSTVEEGNTVEAKGITVSLSGVQTDFLTDILDEFQVGLPAIVYLGFFEDDGVTLVPDPIISWSGRTDQPTIEMDGTTATISVNCENRLVEMNVAVDRRYTNEDQQIDYPGDRGLEFQPSIQDVRIFWGQVPSSKNNL